MLLGRRHHQLQLVAAFTLGLLYIIGYLLQSTYENCSTANDAKFASLSQLQTETGTIVLQADNSIEDHDGRDSLRPTHSGDICSNLETFSSRFETGWKSLTSGLEEYRRFHKHQLAMSEGGSSTHRNIRTLTWYCNDMSMCSGLADQLYRIEFAFILALIFKRVFTINWNTSSGGYKTIQYLQPNLIDWSARIREIPHHQERLPMIDLVKVLDSSTPHVAVSDDIPVPFYRSFTRTKHIPQLNVRYKKLGLLHLLSPKESRYNLVYVMGLLLRYLFKFSSELVQEVNHLQASMGLVSHQYLAVHIRTGFSGNDRFEEKGKFSRSKLIKDPDTWKTMLSCSLKLSSERMTPRSAIYLATDSNLVKKLAKDYDDDKIQTANITAFHSAHCKDECGKGLWIDFILIARARYVIRGASGFSKIASAFCSIPPKNQCNLNCNCKNGI